MEHTTLEVYKCPTCGGALRYDADTGKLACMWCGNDFTTEKLEPKRVNSKLEGYLCPECGAELMADDFIAADTCPYCGNNEVAPHRFEGEFEPDYIIPFSITKEDAIARYEAYVAEKSYLPDDFREEDRIVSIQGTYGPFWLQDGTLDFDFMFHTTYRAGYNIPWTREHRLSGTYDYSRVPADGSARMPNDMMDSIEPYDFSKLKPFSTEYLPGFIAERYTESLEDVTERLRTRIAQSAIGEAKGKINLSKSEEDDEIEFIEDESDYNMQLGESAQVLLPVWLIVVSYQGKKYLVGVNGQTGEIAVNLPIDEKKQTKEALKETGKTALILSPFFIATNCLWIAIIVALFANWGIDGMIDGFAGLFAGDFYRGFRALALIFVVILIAVSIPMFRSNTYSKTKESVRQLMHNVEESTDISRYSTMTITGNNQGWAKGTGAKTLIVILGILLLIAVLLSPLLIGLEPADKSPSIDSSNPSERYYSDSQNSASKSTGSASPNASLNAAKQFINDYNSSTSGKELVLGEEFSPQDENSGHFRKELGESKYKDSSGWTCSAGDVTVDIVVTKPKSATSGSSSKLSDLTVYATGPEESVIEFFRTAAHVLDPNVTDEAIEAGLKEAPELYGLVYIDGSKLTTSYKNGEAKLATTVQIPSE